MTALQSGLYRRPRLSRRAKRGLGVAVRDVLALALLLTLVLPPILYMLVIAVQTPEEVEAGHILPQHWDWQSFTDMWSTINLRASLINSILVSTLTGLVSAPVALGAGYVIARHRFRLRKAFQISLLAAYVFPSVLLLLPLYMIFVVMQQSLHTTIIGGYPALVATYLTLALPFSIWMMHIYVTGLPVEIEEAATIDGASTWQVMRHIILPLSKPGLVVVFIFSFIHSWNDVLFASVMTSSSTRTLGVDLQTFLGDSLSVPLWNELMAASLVSALPAIVLFVIAQRWIVAGLAAGSTKG